MTLKIVHECDSDTLDRGQVMLPQTAAARAAVRDYLHGLGHDVPTVLPPTGRTREAALTHVAAIHRSATILFALWVEYHETAGTVAEMLACACEFNELTAQARDLDETFHLFDHSHLERLKADIRNELDYEGQSGATRIEKWADMLRVCASEHCHERSWPWVVLPAVERQPYSRILRLALPTNDPRYNVFLVQPFFLTRRSTLRHTHGVNWAFSRPLGRAERNTHINFQWQLGPVEAPHKCSLHGRHYYGSNDVVVIHPRTIHSIEKRKPEKGWLRQRLRVSDALSSDGHELLATENRFGEMGCLHLYKPSWSLAAKLDESPFRRSPLPDADKAFFEQFDMIVIDHEQSMAWAGGGGAWALRMLELGPTGDCCAECWVEKDRRANNLDLEELRKWLISEPKDPTIFRD